MKTNFLLLLAFCLPIILSGQVKQEKERESIENESSKTDQNLNPLVFFDNVVIDQEGLQSINPNDVAEIQVIKSITESLIEKYGDTAKGGIIFIKSKLFVAKEWFIFFNSFAQSSELNEIILNENFDYKNYRIVINDKELDTDFFVNLKFVEDEVVKVKFEKSESESELKGKIIVETKKVNT